MKHLNFDTSDILPLVLPGPDENTTSSTIVGVFRYHGRAVGPILPACKGDELVDSLNSPYWAPSWE